MIINHEGSNRIQFDRNNNQHYLHTDYQPFYRHFHHRKEDQMVQSSHHDYRQRENQNHSALKELSIEHHFPSDPPLIHPSTRSPLAPPIDTTSDEEFISFYEELERQIYHNPESNIPVEKLETNKMAPKKTRFATTKAKDL